jgi:prolyl-tRNA editing enzyme YbaK/EbsC (Cys-tRNA(Pro) deacylase)
MKPSVQRVREALAAANLNPPIVEYAESTKTAQEAADALGTTVERIVKSLVFLADGEPLVVLASGVNRVDTAKLGRELGRRIDRADAARVRGATGFAIGGVAPVGYPAPVQTLIDRDLLQYDLVWAAAGTPNHVFPIQPDDLVRVTGGRVLDVRVEPDGDAAGSTATDVG